MATKNVPIDIMKPENYLTRNGEEVLGIYLRNNIDFPLFVVVENGKGNVRAFTVTREGSYRVGNHKNDLFLKPDSQQAQKPSKKRKIISFSAAEINNDLYGYALSDDGVVFEAELMISPDGVEWKKLPEIPQD